MSDNGVIVYLKNGNYLDFRESTSCSWLGNQGVLVINFDNSDEQDVAFVNVTDIIAVMPNGRKKGIGFGSYKPKSY